MSVKLSADEFAALPLSRRIRAIAAGSIGNLVEWYDWLAYSTFSLYFAHVFFPNSEPTAQLLNTAGIFAVGYVMRPVGAVLFGWYADRRGRKAALSASVFLMCGGSLIVALAPGYATIGIAAPVVLILARMLQGLSVGGEYGASAAYLMEVSPARSRGFFVSFHYATLLLGQLLAVLTLVVLQFLLLTPEQLDSWGWRVPFVIGAVLAVVAFYLRSGIDESPSFSEAGPSRENPFKLMLRYPRAIVQVFGMTIGGSVAVNTFSVYMPKFLVNTTGLSKADSTWVSAISLVAFIAMQPLVGALSDRIGRKPCLIAFGVVGTFSAAPLLIGIAGAGNSVTALGLVLIGLAVSTGYSAVNAVTKAELFPVHARAIGVGLPYSIVVAVVGGTSEWLGLLFKHSGFETGYYYYVAATIFVSLLFYLWLPETRPSRSNAVPATSGAS
jgi:MHS family alpha-ketoglutarate permease-like MFS transporter